MRISPAQAGKILGKSREPVVALIRVGEIAASDERQPGAKIPRYRIDPVEIGRWQERRAVIPSATEPVAPVRRVRCVASGLLARMRARHPRVNASEAA